MAPDNDMVWIIDLQKLMYDLKYMYYSLGGRVDCAPALHPGDLGSIPGRTNFNFSGLL